jgi:hypothetical protein
MTKPGGPIRAFFARACPELVEGVGTMLHELCDFGEVEPRYDKQHSAHPSQKTRRVGAPIALVEVRDLKGWDAGMGHPDL